MRCRETLFIVHGDLVGDELGHALLHHRQRDRADGQNGIVKAPLIESWAEFLFGLSAMTTDLQLAELVGQRLSRPRDAAIDFGGGLASMTTIASGAASNNCCARWSGMVGRGNSAHSGTYTILFLKPSSVLTRPTTPGLQR
jgi:hypothetical protein